VGKFGVFGGAWTAHLYGPLTCMDRLLIKYVIVKCQLSAKPPQIHLLSNFVFLKHIECFAIIEDFILGIHGMGLFSRRQHGAATADTTKTTHQRQKRGPIVMDMSRRPSFRQWLRVT
jgi:hypothetical protein